MNRKLVFSMTLLSILVLITYITNNYKFLKKRFSSNLNYEIKEGEKRFINEVIDIISSPKSFYIFDTIQKNWETEILEKTGNVAYVPSQPFPYFLAEDEQPVEMPPDYLYFTNNSDHLYLFDDLDAHVIWEVNLPGPLKRGYLICTAQTTTANTEIVAISNDLARWRPFSIRKSSQTVEVIEDLKCFKGSRKIYIKFYESKRSMARFYGYMVLAETY